MKWLSHFFRSVSPKPSLVVPLLPPTRDIENDSVALIPDPCHTEDLQDEVRRVEQQKQSQRSFRLRYNGVKALDKALRCLMLAWMVKNNPLGALAYIWYNPEVAFPHIPPSGQVDLDQVDNSGNLITAFSVPDKSATAAIIVGVYADAGKTPATQGFPDMREVMASIHNLTQTCPEVHQIARSFDASVISDPLFVMTRTEADPRVVMFATVASRLPFTWPPRPGELPDLESDAAKAVPPFDCLVDAIRWISNKYETSMVDDSLMAAYPWRSVLAWGLGMGAFGVLSLIALCVALKHCDDIRDFLCRKSSSSAASGVNSNAAGTAPLLGAASAAVPVPAVAASSAVPADDVAPLLPPVWDQPTYGSTNATGEVLIEAVRGDPSATSEGERYFSYRSVQLR